MRFAYILLLVMLLPIVSALDLYSNQAPIDIKFFCNFQGAPCSASANATITILYSNNSVSRLNQIMSYSTPYFNYTLPVNYTAGTYNSIVYACDQGKCSNTEYQFSVDHTTEGFSLYNANNGTTLAIIGIISLILVLIGLFAQIMFIGVLGGLAVMVFGVSIGYLSNVFGYITIGAGFILIVYFAFVMKSDA